MKKIEILKGDANDVTDIYYLMELNPGCVERDIISDDYICEAAHSYKIVFKSDSGCYPGTVPEMHSGDINYIVDELLAKKIITKCKTGYSQGINY